MRFAMNPGLYPAESEVLTIAKHDESGHDYADTPTTTTTGPHVSATATITTLI
jgi:hypothetical protein